MIWREPTHWPTHPPNHPPYTYPKVGVCPQIINLQNRIKLSRLDQILLKFSWFHIFRPTNPPIHPPTTKKTPTHGWGILHRFQIFKRNRNILIRWSLIAFLLIWGGYPPWGWVGGWVGVGLGGGTPHARAHAHTRTHVRTHMHAC